MLGLSYGEVLLMLGAGAVLLGELRSNRATWHAGRGQPSCSACAGPKDMPVLARGAGLVAGRAAAWLAGARQKFAHFSQEAELSQVGHAGAAALLEAQQPSRGLAG